MLDFWYIYVLQLAVNPNPATFGYNHLGYLLVKEENMTDNY